MKPILVSVRWHDAHATATATYEMHELPHRAIEIVTYGLLLRDDEEGISIASEDCGDGCYRGVTFIPRSLVREVKPIKRPRKPKAVTNGTRLSGVVDRPEDRQRKAD